MLALFLGCGISQRDDHEAAPPRLVFSPAGSGNAGEETLGFPRRERTSIVARIDIIFISRERALFRHRGEAIKKKGKGTLGEI